MGINEGLRENDMLLLFDQYDQNSQDLHTSFKLAGYDCPAVVIEDNGFLPDDVISVYGFFLGDFQAAAGAEAGPKYFNEITVPDYWEISGTNQNGEIQDLNKKRGKIFYSEPKHKRFVRIVDWYDDRGVARSSDHYNRYGAIFARTILNGKGQRVNKSYFSSDGREVIVENYVTGDIILNEGGETQIFRNKTDFILYFFVKANFRQSRIFFNSLSTPFFVSNRLQSKSKRDILFWQEPKREDIPGNMQSIFNRQASRTETVIVQRQRSYEKLLSLGANPDMVRKLGFVYPFEKENTRRPEALICTNSDQIEHCRELIEGLPEIHFHIAALTEMSSRLTGMDRYKNVSLYPGAKAGTIEKLFQKCDFYFDINRESEIVSAVRRAFLHNHLIFAFRETVHDETYVAETHIYPSNRWERMVSDVKSATADPKALESGLERQRKAALAEDRECYRRF